MTHSNGLLDSDEEWEFTSIPVQKKSSPSLSSGKTKKRPTLSEASFRTIRASLPKSTNSLKTRHGTASPLPTMVASAPITPLSTPDIPERPMSADIPSTDTSLSLQYISDDELERICQQMNADLLIRRLIQVYKSHEIYLKIREIETASSFIEARLANHLHYCTNPGDFILNTLSALSTYFTEHARNKELSSRFRRLLTTNLCTALDRFLNTSLEAQRTKCAELAKTEEETKEVDLISFDDQISTVTKEMDLISFEDQVLETAVTESSSSDDEEEEEESDDDEDNVITLAQMLGISEDFMCRFSLRPEHQQKLIEMIDTISSPVIIYYAMDVFKLSDCIAKGCAHEEEGAKLCRILIKHNHYDEAIICVRRLDLFDWFPVASTADQFLTAGYGPHLLLFYQDQHELQRELVRFVNKQLRFTYAGNLDIVPARYFEDLYDGTDKTPQLSRLKERKFQKDLVTCGAKLIKELEMDETSDDCYFIMLSQRYSTLRFILAQRAIQQLEDNDISIVSSANFNGLIDLVCEDDPVMARLAIKEMIDMGDTNAPPYFASLYKQQEFYCRYNALPLNQRLLGTVKGELMSRHRSTLTPKKTKNTKLPEKVYQLPAKAKCVMVNSGETLMQMKNVLSTSTICGLDTEWVPAFAKTGVVKTALMQIATDIDGYVFLVDFKTLFEPEHAKLLHLAQVILGLLFEDDQILKIGKSSFDFSGDLDLLHSSMSSSKAWKLRNMLDLKSIETKQGTAMIGGLSGVVAEYLGCSLNKRQQLSNWEKRPLSPEQIVYASCDAYCLLDIFYVLKKSNHPFLRRLNRLGPIH
ncbi:hypothetical protein EDC96DRAFT_571325 [Choanephora cucurbitarum]|nr:hypothetical protein EDC96DRAFT_571325 [Choanephora cucurbitarum]